MLHWLMVMIKYVYCDHNASCFLGITFALNAEKSNWDWIVHKFAH